MKLIDKKTGMKVGDRYELRSNKTGDFLLLEVAKFYGPGSVQFTKLGGTMAVAVGGVARSTIALWLSTGALVKVN